MRRLSALAVVILHVLLLALFMSGMGARVHKDPDMPVFVSLWLSPPEPARPELHEPSEPTNTETAAPRPNSSGIPVLIEVPAADSPPAVSTGISGPATAPDVDWKRMGTLSARSAGQQLGIDQQQGFSPPPRTVPKTCKPRESSMQWNGEEDRRVTWAGPLPVVKVGKRCVVMLVFFACNLSEIPEANSHLLDDMRNPDRAPSSVPDPNICD